MSISVCEQASALSVPATFVMHVKNGYEKRAGHIEKMLGRLGIPFEYILDGDIPDITDDIINSYFTGTEMTDATAPVSCALKHLLACERMLDAGLPDALMLEDDIMLHGNFVSVFNKSVEQARAYAAATPGPVMVSYEDTRLRFVPRSRRKKGIVIYKGDRDRMTGAYYINAAAARLIVDYARNHKIDRPIDLFHCDLLRRGLLTYFWCQPTIATQGSHTGAFASAINFNKSMLSPLMWRLKLSYKKILYNLR